MAWVFIKPVEQIGRAGWAWITGQYQPTDTDCPFCICYVGQCQAHNEQANAQAPNSLGGNFHKNKNICLPTFPHLDGYYELET